jgi:hypothetical protein
VGPPRYGHQAELVGGTVVRIHAADSLTQFVESHCDRLDAWGMLESAYILIAPSELKNDITCTLNSP